MGGNRLTDELVANHCERAIVAEHAGRRRVLLPRDDGRKEPRSSRVPVCERLATIVRRRAPRGRRLDWRQNGGNAQHRDVDIEVDGTARLRERDVGGQEADPNHAQSRGGQGAGEAVSSLRLGRDARDRLAAGIDERNHRSRNRCAARRVPDDAADLLGRGRHGQDDEGSECSQWTVDGRRQNEMGVVLAEQSQHQVGVPHSKLFNHPWPSPYKYEPRRRAVVRGAGVRPQRVVCSSRAIEHAFNGPSRRIWLGPQSSGDGPLRSPRYHRAEGARSDLSGRFSVSPFSRTCPNGETGRRTHPVSVRRKRRAGSSPASGTPSTRDLTRRTRRHIVRILTGCVRQLRLASEPASPTGPRVLCLGPACEAQRTACSSARASARRENSRPI